MSPNVLGRYGTDVPATSREPECQRAETQATPKADFDGARLVFIVGHKKSGSTWLLNLLSLHPDLRGVMETHLFHHGWTEPDPVRRTAKLFTQTPWAQGGPGTWPLYKLNQLAKPLLLRAKPALSLAAHERPAVLHDLSLREQLALRRELRWLGPPDVYARRFFQRLRDRLRPGRYLIEKSPRNVHHAGRIRALFPAAKLVAIYRDGRDVVVSDRFFTEVYGGRPFSFEDSVRAWRRDMETHFDCLEQHRLWACSYEELLANGAAVVKRLLRFLELPGDDALEADLLERSSFRFHAGRERGHENRRRFYRKGIVGDWRNHFTAEDKRIFKDLAGDMLIRLGYEKDLAW